MNVCQITNDCVVYAKTKEFECIEFKFKKRPPINLTQICHINNNRFIECKRFNENVQLPLQVKQYNRKDCTLYKDLPRKKIEADSRIIQKKRNELNTRIPTIEEAVVDYRLGFQPAFNYIYRFFEPKMRYMAKDKSRNNDVIYDDLMSDLIFQLMECVNKYNSGKVKFNTFFWRCAQNVVGMYFTKKNAKKRSSEFGEISINTMIDEDTDVDNFVCDERSEQLFEKSNIKCVWEKTIMPILNEQEATALRLSVDGYDMNEISKIMGLTRSAVYTRTKNAKDKIRNIFTQQQISELFM